MPPPPAQPPQVALYGIVAETSGARAMIRTNGDKVVRVRIGDDVDGWKVTKIERQQIELTLADRAVSFAMFSSNSAAPVNAAEAANEDDDPQADSPSQQRRRSRE